PPWRRPPQSHPKPGPPPGRGRTVTGGRCGLQPQDLGLLSVSSKDDERVAGQRSLREGEQRVDVQLEQSIAELERELTKLDEDGRQAVEVGRGPASSAQQEWGEARLEQHFPRRLDVYRAQPQRSVVDGRREHA